MATKKRQVLIRFQPNIYEKLQVIAAKDKRTITNLVEYWIEQNLEQYEDMYGKIAPLVQNNNGNVFANTGDNYVVSQ